MKAEDYECIDVTGLEPLIKEETLPSREDKRRVVYEDYLYLLEGMRRRQNRLTGWVNSDGSAKPREKPAMSRLQMDRKAFRDAADCYHARFGTLYRLNDFRDPDVVVSTGSVIPVADLKSLPDDEDVPSMPDLLNKLGLVLVVPERVDYSCSVSDMERAFRNLAKTTRAADSGFPREVNSSLEVRRVWTEEKDDGQKETTYDEWVAATLPPVVYSVSCAPDGGGVNEYRGTLSATFTRGWVKSGIAALRFSTSVNGGVSTERGKAWVDEILVPLAVTQDGRLKLEGFDREGLVKLVLGSHGEPYIVTPTASSSDEWYSASVQMSFDWALVDHDFESKSRQAS